MADAIAAFDEVIETEPARRDGKMWKPSSISNFRQYRARVESLYGSMPLSSLTTDVIRDTLLTLIRSKPPTARRIKWIMHAVTTWASENGYAVPDIGWSSIRIKPAGKVTTTLTPPEIKALIDRCAAYWKNADEQTLSRSARTLLIELALWTGKRQQQLCSIEMEHIFAGHIWIAEKTREEGDIVLSPAIREIVDRAIVLRGAVSSPLLFPELVNAKGGCTDSINEMFKLYCRQCDIWRITVDPKTRKTVRKTPTMHDLRRTYASVAYRSGLDSLTTAHLIGHSDDEVTKDYYLHFAREMLAEAQQRVSRTLEMIAAGKYDERLTPILLPTSLAERLLVKAQAAGHQTVEAWMEALAV